MDEQNQKNENTGFHFPIFIIGEKSHGSDNPVLIEEAYALSCSDIVTGAASVCFLPSIHEADPSAKLPWFSFRPLQNIGDLRVFISEYPAIEGIARNPRCYKIGAGVELCFETDNERFDKMSFCDENGIHPVILPKPEES